MSDFGPGSTVREVLERSRRGRELLWAHGYEVGEGFVDVLSQYQSLEVASRAGRLRDMQALLGELNSGD